MGAHWVVMSGWIMTLRPPCPHLRVTVPRRVGPGALGMDLALHLPSISCDDHRHGQRLPGSGAPTPVCVKQWESVKKSIVSHRAAQVPCPPRRLLRSPFKKNQPTSALEVYRSMEPTFFKASEAFLFAGGNGRSPRRPSAQRTGTDRYRGPVSQTRH